MESTDTAVVTTAEPADEADEKPSKAKPDAELSAIRRITSILDGMTYESAKRVLTFVVDRFGDK